VGVAVPARGPMAGETDLGARLLALAAEAVEAGVDAEAALRSAVRELELRVRGAEQARGSVP
jgi:XTP/dITP diphosphohydrolase